MHGSVIISDLGSLIKQPTLLFEGREIFISQKDYEIIKRLSGMEVAKFLLANIKKENIIEVTSKARLLGFSSEENYFISFIKEMMKKYQVNVLTDSETIKYYCKRNNIWLL